MIKHLRLLAALLVLTSAPAFPQQPALTPSNNGYPFFVLSTCGGLGMAPNTWMPAFMDTTGRLCTSVSTGGGGGSSTITNSGFAAYGTDAAGNPATKPPLYNGYLDATAVMRGVSPATQLPAHDYDQRATSVSLSAASGSVLDIPLNGAGEVGLRFAGLAASGATITYYSANDATQTPTSPISSFNASTGATSPTRTTDGETRVPVSARATLRLQVTSGGTGTITISYNATASTNIVDVGSPLPAGTNALGVVGAYGPDAVGAAPTRPPLFNGFVDANNNILGVSPSTPLPVKQAAPQADVRSTGTLDATKTSGAGSFIDIPFNSTGTLGLTFTGLAASGATVSYFITNTAGNIPASTISSINASTGQSNLTRNTDGEARIGVSGHATLRVQVTTPGTGTITVGANLSVSVGIVDVRTPITIYQNYQPLSSTNGLPTTDTNAAQSFAAPGTSTAKAQSVQAPDGGVIAKDGADISGATMPSGGSGIRGWLSAVYAKLLGTLTVQGAANGTPIIVRQYQPTYTLLSNASATGSVTSSVYGASYLFNVVGTFGASCTVALQALAADGATYQTVFSATAASTTGVVLGTNATVKATVSGTCSGLYASLS